jgi:hypothetical protein
MIYKFKNNPSKFVNAVHNVYYYNENGNITFDSLELTKIAVGLYRDKDYNYLFSIPDDLVEEIKCWRIWILYENNSQYESVDFKDKVFSSFFDAKEFCNTINPNRKYVNHFYFPKLAG